MLTRSEATVKRQRRRCSQAAAPWAGFRGGVMRFLERLARNIGGLVCVHIVRAAYCLIDAGDGTVRPGRGHGLLMHARREKKP
jgi:hypothetical protein